MLLTTTQLDEQVSDDPLFALLPGIITAGTLLVAFTLLAAGFDYLWIVFPLGFGGVLPMAIGYQVYANATVHQPSVRSASDEEDALETLKQQYARGELSDREFEQRVEQLLETESAGHRHGS